MQVMNIHDAKTQLSKLLEQVQEGEEVIIARAGHKIARLVPYAPSKRRISPPGFLKNKIWMAEDFDAPLDELFGCMDKKEAA
jgi:prevent-host-death family protein